jgi:hypothetical protein
MTPWQEVRALAEKWRQVAELLRGSKGGRNYRVRGAGIVAAAHIDDCASDIEALIRDPAFIGMMEDAARYRKLRGMSLRDVAVIFDPGMDRDATRVMRDRDTRIDAFQRAALSAQLAGDGEEGK